MDQGSLVTEQIEAGTSFLGEFEKNIPISAAFWLKTTEEGSFYLYVVSDQFNERNLDVAYGEVLRIAAQLRNPDFDPFQVKLINPFDPLAKAVIRILQQYTGRMATRIHQRKRNFGGIEIEEVYIYPIPVTI